MSISGLFISLDIGGTKTSGVALHFPNGPWFKLQAPSKNLRLMVDLELGALLNAILTMLPSPELRQHAVWLIGGAGARPDRDRQRISLLLKDMGIHFADVRVFPDFMGNWAAITGGRDGIISVNGTGSVLFGRCQGCEERRGGWGYLLDEVPSGAKFGIWALHQLLEEIEEHQGTGLYHDLFADTLPDFSITRDVILEKLYGSSSPQRFVGGFSPFFVRAMQQGHPQSVERFNRSLQALTDQAVHLAETLQYPSPVPISGVGGLWEKWPEFGFQVLQALDAHCPGRFELRLPVFSPDWGPFIRYLVTDFPDRLSWENALRMVYSSR
jgi:N-acetylglucosamine kinase-like BadF-type ATPase